jgi:RNA polymerase sigma-B factor
LLLRLPARERRLMAMRFYGNQTQTEIAAELGISQMHVSRLLSRALAWLREAMLSDVPPPWDGTAGDAHELRTVVRRSADSYTVRISGEMDRDTAEGLHRRLRRVITTGDCVRVVIDLAAVVLVDAAGAAVLRDVVQSARHLDVEVVVTRAHPFVARILAVSGLPSSDG